MASPVDCYAVMGNPVTHSKSPIIHALFAESTEHHIRYEALEVEPTQFEAAVTHFFDSGHHGLSITVPFKERAWSMAQAKTERAIKAGAVNTLYKNKEGVLAGDNTDGIGLIRDLTLNKKLSLTGLNVLILGAGGAVRGIMEPLLNEQPERVTIANRTESKAQRLAELFNNPHTPITASSLEASGQPYDLIINGTSMSLQNQKLTLPRQLINATTRCYDMMYSPTETLFNQWARQAGAKECFDGLGMLVEQASEQFFIWRGVRPETKKVLARLRDMM